MEDRGQDRPGRRHRTIGLTNPASADSQEFNGLPGDEDSPVRNRLADTLPFYRWLRWLSDESS